MVKEKVNGILNKIKNNKKKVIGVTAIVFVAFIFTFTVYNLNNPTKFNRLFANVLNNGKPANDAFEDNTFYSCVVDAYNSDNGTSRAYTDNLTDEELAGITNLECKGWNYSDSDKITSAKGVEKLTGLTSLSIFENRLTSIDLSSNVSLVSLNLGSNQLTNIDLSNNTSLTNLVLNYNQLTSIDVSKNTNLTELDLQNNQLTSIDLSSNTSLTTLNLSWNKLTSINLSPNIALTELHLDENDISSLDLSNNSSLRYLGIDDTPLKDDILMQLGETYQIKEKIVPPKGQGFTYSISDTSVATIEGNTITAKSEGSTILKATIGNITFERKLVVGKVVLSTEEENIIINDEKKYIYTGGKSIEDIEANIGNIIEENNLIKVVYNGEVLEEYKHIYIKNAVRGYEDNYLIMYLSADNPNYNNAINCTYDLSKDGKEISIKYEEEEIAVNKVIYIYLPFKFKTDKWDSLTAFDDIKPTDYNDKIDIINNKTEVDKNRINILNADIEKENDGDNLVVNLLNGPENKIGELYISRIIYSDSYDLSKDYIYLGNKEFNRNINVSTKGGVLTDNELAIELKINDNVISLGGNIYDFYFEWDLIKVSSDKYDMSSDIINLGNEDIDLTKINVTNATLKVDNNKLLVMYGEEVVKEFKLEGGKKTTTTTKKDDEKTITTKDKTTTKEETKTTTTKKKVSIIDKLLGNKETTTVKKEETTTKKNIFRKSTTTKLENSSGNVTSNNKNIFKKLVTGSNLLILLLSVIDIALITYIIIDKKKIKNNN